MRRIRPDTIASNEHNSDAPPVELAPDIVEIAGSVSDMTPAQAEARRDALKSMLSASAARYEQFIRNRPPPLAKNVRVKVLSGAYMGQEGLVKDADYIEQRVLVVLAQSTTPHWFEFAQVHALKNGEEG